MIEKKEIKCAGYKIKILDDSSSRTLLRMTRDREEERDLCPSCQELCKPSIVRILNKEYHA